MLRSCSILILKTLFKFISQCNLVPFLENGSCTVGNELDKCDLQLYSQVTDSFGDVIVKRINIRLFDLLALFHYILNLHHKMVIKRTEQPIKCIVRVRSGVHKFDSLDRHLSLVVSYP